MLAEVLAFAEVPGEGISGWAYRYTAGHGFL